MPAVCETTRHFPAAVTPRPTRPATRLFVTAALVLATSVLGVAPAAAQFGALRDAARRAAEEKRKADEARRQADEARRKQEEQATAPADAPAPDATPAASPATAPAASGAAPGAANAGAEPTFQSYSKFDFVPGERVVGVEDFMDTPVGDFPGRWNTNASAEAVTLAGQPGRWLKLTRAGFFVPEFITDLPENVTVEFDLAVPPSFAAGFPLEFALVQLNNLKQPDEWQGTPNSILFTAHPSASNGVSTATPRQEGTSAAANSTTTSQLAAKNGKPVHVALWRQRQRVRLYLNEEKIWDLPRALATTARLNSLIFFVRGGCADCEYYLANLRVATGAPDTRNKILTEGKWVTHGILFDVNSDRIRAESYGTLKEIAGVLTENADLKIQIVGHTDADGDDVANMDLSKRRAAAVKAALASEFKVDVARLDTDGKGESQPVDRNDNPAGKANNRRVEFIRR
ncbi:MAG TPA: OmpA family protein [Vicinamibacterales bacterium]|nr:OmpA family protein [Vicinamibacterales bacterium]